MSFIIITHVKHTHYNGNIYAYGPYVREMNLWFKHVSKVVVVAPLDTNAVPGKIDMAYTHPQIQFVSVPTIQFTSFASAIKSALALPYIIFILINQMRKVTHIHLRCPGNMGLLGSFVQILFPFKKKTAKYAGNWDWNSKQPWTYRLQQSILRNTFLTKNMQVLVYGEWPDRTENIKPFFTASYTEKDKLDITKSELGQTINLIFVGGLTKNKRPLLALEVLKELLKKELNTILFFCGEGIEREKLETFSAHYQLVDRVQFLGNVDAERVKKELQKAHFLIFGSQSEGWPKVVAEAMWWGCIPVTTAVSCVPQMLGQGSRGILCKPDAQEMAVKIQDLLVSPEKYAAMIIDGMGWARKFTTERFEAEIKKLLHS